MPTKTICTDYALYYINRFPKTEKELKIQLIKKGYNESDIDHTMLFLKSKKYVDDTIFTKLYIESELIKKGKPTIVVRQKLLEKGVDKQIINTTIEAHQEDITEGIHQALKKDIDQYKKKGIDGIDIVQKLMRKGYSYYDIKQYTKTQHQDI